MRGRGLPWLLLSIALIALALFAYSRWELPPEVALFLPRAQEFFAAAPLLAIGLFYIVHFLSSFLALPGSCTLLNTLAGAVVGWLGACLLLFPITVLSAIVGFALGRKLQSLPFLQKTLRQLERLRPPPGQSSFWFLVALRWSPLIPFGFLNLALGAFGLSWRLFFLTLLPGIFFDLVLLSGAGAAFFAQRSSRPVAVAALGAVLLALVLVRFLGKQLLHPKNHLAGSPPAS